MSWLHGAAERLRLFFGRQASESRIETELQFHIEMETDRLVRELGLDRDEARRRALVAFGGVEKHREDLRDGRGAAWLGGLSLDFKLGLRMLAKYPGLTLVGVLGMSVAVTIGALAFAAVGAVTGTALPFDEGDRVVAIQNIDTKRNDDDSRTHLHDLVTWRETLRAVEDLGAFRNVNRNLIPPNASPEAVRVAEMTASGFRLARVAPRLGRYLNDDDERESAPDVVVIGYEVWQNRFGGRTDVVGSTVQLGTVRHTVVGVMPKGFAFPVNNQIWTPLRLNPTAFERGKAPSIDVFGRLAPGASIADARQQLTTIGQRLAAEYPKTHERIRPRLVPYAQRFVGGGPQMKWLLHLGQVVVSLLLVVIGTNVAVLVYARTASRAGEMAVRTALGASRRRIVTQLFAEALVLSAAASVVGLVVAQFVFRHVEAMVRQSADDGVPYWMRLEITPSVIVYVAGLAVLAAVIIGVIPGLKATRPRVYANLKEVSGGSSMRLGRTWTALLITQVAMSVAALPVALSGAEGLVRLALFDYGTAVTESVVTATPLLDMQDASGGPVEDDKTRRARYTTRVAALAQKLEAEPGGFDVVLMASAPGAEQRQAIDVDLIPADTVSMTRNGEAVAVGHVDSEFFAAFDIRALAGRSFTAADFASAIPPAIVNRSFVQHFLRGGNALGRRVRLVPEEREARRTGAEPGTGPWREIVGIVDDFPALTSPNDIRPRVYLPLAPAGIYPMTLAVRARALAPAAAAIRIREVGLSVDPMLRFTTIRTLEDVLNDEMEVNRLVMLAVVMVGLSVVLLSAAGIYALMSFTVARREREIGIRAALGAQRGRILTGILSRAMRQIGIGIAIGVVGSMILARPLGESAPVGELAVMVLKVAAMMAIVGLVATIGPARRALKVQPTDALRAE